MEFLLCSDLYWDFRRKIAGNFASAKDFHNYTAQNIQPLAQTLNVAYLACGLLPPPSQLGMSSECGKQILYHDTTILPIIPQNTEIAETLSTGEQGTFTIDIHPIPGHHFSDEERKALQMLTWDLYVHGAKARLTGIAMKSAQTDFMTGAVNQSGLLAFCGKLQAQRKFHNYTGLFINLKNFKYINKSLGSPMGDNALRIFAENTRQGLNEDEMIARLGGDNFFALLLKEHVDDFISKYAVQDITLSKGPKPMNIRLQARMGVYPIREKDTINELMGNASIAMNVGKTIRTTDIIYFSNEMLIKSLHQREISSEFHNALKSKEFVVYYQPKVNLNTKQLCGCEALVRWIRYKTIVPPIDFVPVLEREGYICELDFYVLETVCKDLRKWIDLGLKPTRISTNFSKLHLKNPNFAKNILEILGKYNVDASYIEVELTEVSDYDDNLAMQKVVEILKSNGISVSIDDFGTGYSTLNVLKDSNVNAVKLDKSLLNNIGNPESQDEVILKNVIKMAQEMNKDVIAEGVETEKQAIFLKSINCHNAQGYLFDKPLGHEEFQKRLSSEKPY